MARDNSGIINYGSIGGDASVEHIDNTAGDTVSIEATNSTVNVEHQAMQPDAESAQLRSLVDELRAALRELPEGRSADVERLERQLGAVDGELQRDEPDRGMLAVSAEGVRKAAEFVADVAPNLLRLATRLAGLLQGAPI